MQFQDTKKIDNSQELAWSNLYPLTKNKSKVLQLPQKHTTHTPRVAVLLGYFNGNSYLHEQLYSILEQSHKNLEIFISDDCSDDSIDLKKLNIPCCHKEKLKVHIRKTNTGFTNNFLNSLGSIENDFEYYAFSDQDDIWNQNKLQNALEVLEKLPKNIPALYCARTSITDENCELNLGTSPLFNKKPSFVNALVQNIGGGNTMVFNKVAKDLIYKSSIGLNIVSHDWWCYQIVSGAGGIIHYDTRPCLKYRQHNRNLVGSNNSWKARLIRLRKLLAGNYRDWNDKNLSALEKNKERLTAENQEHLKHFTKARASNFFNRIKLFKRSGIYRQTLLGNIGLVAGVILKKV